MDNVIKEENAINKTADSAEAVKTEAAQTYGKFSSASALLSAYESLEAEFTRRSQRLKELEEGNKTQNMPPDGGASSPESENNRERFIERALNDETVRKAVIEDYLKSVYAEKDVPLIAGGVSAAAPRVAPKSVKEAGALAERFLKHGKGVN